MNENGKNGDKELKPSSVLAMRTGAKPMGFVPQTLDDCYRVSKLLAMTNMIPDSYRNKPDETCAAILLGLEVGLAPMAALQSIAVINGKPAIWGDGALALVRASGLLEIFEETYDPSLDGGTATCRVKRRGEAPLVRTFSMRQARTAGLLNKKGPWHDYPERMCQMRARSWALRDAFADVLKGLSIAEEARDIPMRDVTPAITAHTVGHGGGPDIEDVPDIPEPVDPIAHTKVEDIEPVKEVTDDIFLDLLDDKYSKAPNLDALNEVMLRNELQVEERGLEQAAANMYAAHQKRIYQGMRR